MSGTYQFEQDNLFLRLKNMPKPPISKELAKEIGFDPKKYEVVIDKLLYQISEVRKERLKENLIFEEKLKTLQNDISTDGHNKNRNIFSKNKVKNNTKNIKLNLYRPKSNYKSVKSSGYGIAPKKIDIFSNRIRKKTKDNIKHNNIPSQKIPIKRNKKNMPNTNIIPNNKSNHSTNIKYYNNNSNKNINLSKNKNTNKLSNLNNLIKEEKNNINNNINTNENDTQLLYYQELMNQIEKIQNENKIIEYKYQNFSENKKNILNNMDNKSQININNINDIKDKKEFNVRNSYYKNNSELISKNLDLISKKIINDLLYELVFDLKNIEDQKSARKKIDIKNEKEKIKLESKNNNKTNNCKFKYKANIKKEMIEKLDKNKNNFKKYMKFKGSFLKDNIFEIYDECVEEMSKLVLIQELDYCIKQMDDFINKIESIK